MAEGFGNEGMPFGIPMQLVDGPSIMNQILPMLMNRMSQAQTESQAATDGRQSPERRFDDSREQNVRRSQSPRSSATGYPGEDSARERRRDRQRPEPQERANQDGRQEIGRRDFSFMNVPSGSIHLVAVEDGPNGRQIIHNQTFGDLGPTGRPQPTQQSGESESPGNNNGNVFEFMFMTMLQELNESMQGHRDRENGAEQTRPQFGPPRPDEPIRATGFDFLSEILGIHGNPGDYAMGQRALDEIMSQLMERHAERNRPPAASRETIASLPRTPFQKEGSLADDCAVCQENYTEGEEIIHLPCKHIFHPSCILNWLELNGTCPVCRFSLVTGNPAASNNPSGRSSPTHNAHADQTPAHNT